MSQVFTSKTGEPRKEELSSIKERLITWVILQWKSKEDTFALVCVWLVASNSFDAKMVVGKLQISQFIYKVDPR